MSDGSCDAVRVVDVSANEPSVVKRRVPTQERARLRVGRILDAAAQIVVRDGVDGVTTRAVAHVADMPVATLYQYFADRDAVLLSLVERDMDEMDQQVRADLAELDRLSVRSLVDTTMRAYLKVYHRRPAFVVIWMRGRTNAAIYDYGREHNRRTAAELVGLAEHLGLAGPRMTPTVAELAVEVGDRVFQLAFERDLQGDPFLIGEGIDMMVAYLERYATPAGIEGVPTGA